MALAKRLPAVVAALGGLCMAAPGLAHDALEDHDGLVWCGDSLAVSTDRGLLLVQGSTRREVALPERARLLRYSPGCQQIAVVADGRVRVVEPSGSAIDLGPFPAPLSSGRFVGGLQPSISWAPSGKRFAVAAVAYGAYDDVLLVYDVASRKATPLSSPGRVIIKGFALLDDNTAILAANVLQGGGTSIYRTDTSSHKQLTPTLFSDVALSESPVVVVGGTVGGGVVQLDPATGSERQISATGNLLPGGITQDRSKVVLQFGRYTPQSRCEVVPLAGGPGAPSHSCPVVPSYFPDLGWAPDGSSLVQTKPLKVKVVLDPLDPKTPPRTLLNDAAGSAAHIRVSPNGETAALLVETGGCSRGASISNARTDLWLVSLSGPPKPKRIGTVARSRNNCVVE
jgi:hypothetical protein